MNEKLKKALITFVTILIVLLMIFSFGGRDRVTALESTLGSVFSPIQRTLTKIGLTINDKVEPFVNVLRYKDMNAKLLQENAALKAEVVNLTMTRKDLNELNDLKESLKYVQENQVKEYISTQVVAKDFSNWFNMFTIDAGYNQGITKNSTVINGSGLVGLVYEVGSNWSKVIAIIDHQSFVGIEMLRPDDNYYGVLSGSTQYGLNGHFYTQNPNVQEGEYVVTSGLGIYPRGILVGQISEISKDENEFLRRIKVEPAVDFNKINKVLVIPYDEKAQ